MTEPTLTTRELFSLQILCALLTKDTTTSQAASNSDRCDKQLTQRATQIADALIKELNG